MGIGGKWAEASKLASVLALATGACLPSLEGLTGGRSTGPGPQDADSSMDGPGNPNPDVGTCNANLDNDPSNCGRCGHDCTMHGLVSDGKCAMGECQPRVFISGANPAEIAEDHQHLYWAEKGDNANIYMINHDGTGGQVLLASGQHNPRGLLPRKSTRLYWACQGVSVGPGRFAPGTGTIASIRFGAPSTGDLIVIQGENVPMYIVADGTNLYWTAHGNNANPAAGKPDGAIRQCAPEYPCDSGTTIVADQFGPTDIGYAMGNRSLYWTTEPAALDAGEGSVWSVHLGSSAVRLTSGVVRASWLSLDEITGTLYFTSSALGTITKWPMGGANGGVLIGQSAPGRITAGGGPYQFLHWINSGTQGSGSPDSAVVRLLKTSFPVGNGTSQDIELSLQGRVGAEWIAVHDLAGPQYTPLLVYSVSPEGDIMQTVQKE